MKTKLPSLIPILILTLVTVVMWVSLDIYRNIVKPTQSNVPASVSQALTPSLDKAAIDEIESRSFLDDSQIPNSIINSAVINVTPSPSPAGSPIPEASAQPTSASSSATTQ